MQLSKAAEIPEELFEHIVWHIRGDNRGNDKERKRHLSVFGLVCRYWTRLCRPGLFSHITLRAPTDVKRFHEILDTPPPSPSIDPVADALITLFAEPDHSVEPWLHLVFSLLVPKLHKLAFLSVKPLHPGGKPYRTLHPSLPRSVPGSCMQIDDLCLDGLHFSSTRVLSRLLLSLPSLVSLNVYNLTIDTNLPTLKDLFAAPLCTQINSVKSDNLQLCLSPIPLLVGNSINSSNPAEQTQSRRRTRGILNGDDLEALWELLSIFDAASSFEIGRTHKGESQDLNFHCFCNAAGWDPRSAPETMILSLTIHLSRNGDHRAVRQGRVLAVLPVMFQVHAVTVDITRLVWDKAQGILHESLWTRFVETALKFPHLQNVKLERRVSSPGREPASIGLTEAAFRPLIDAGKFVCRVVDYEWKTVLVSTNTISPKAGKNRVDKAANGSGVSSSESDEDEDEDEDEDMESEWDVESKEAEDDPVDDDSKENAAAVTEQHAGRESTGMP